MRTLLAVTSIVACLKLAESLHRSRRGKFLLSVAAVAALLALSDSGSRLQAGDGSPSPPVRAAAATAANTNSLSTSADRALLKKIRQAWREREERVQTLLLVYVMTHTDGPARARWRRETAERLNKNATAPLEDPAKEAEKDAVRDPRQRPIVKLAEPFSLHLFALRESRLRSERWERPSEKEARALLANLTPGKDCEIASIEGRDRDYALRPNSPDPFGHKFRHIDIMPHTDHFATTPYGLFLLLNYRSSLVPGDWLPFELARVNTVLAKAGGLDTVPANAGKLNKVPAKGKERSQVVVSFPDRDVWLDPSRDYLVTQISTRAVRTVCEYEQAPAPLDWVPKKITSTWLPGARLAGTVEECVTVDWATGDNKVPKELFEFDYPDGTTITERAEESRTEDHGQTTKHSIVWKGKLIPVSKFRPWSESLERIKKGELTAPDGK